MFLYINFRKSLMCTIFIIVSILLISCSLQASFANDYTITNSSNETILEGLDETGDGDTLFLSSGTYNKTNDFGININKNITLEGNGLQDSVIIDAQGNSYIFTISDDVSVKFINIKFINGNGLSGGAVDNRYMGTNLTFINCTFENNTASNDGGAIYNHGSNFKVENCIFENNTAGNDGGAIYNYYGHDFILNSSTFINNSALWGGAIANIKGNNSIVENCSFTDNSAIIGSGAIYNSGNGSMILNSNFTNNTSNSSEYGGGAIFNDNGSDFEVHNSSFINNSVSGDGGAISNNAGINFYVYNSSFINNFANGEGGALYNTGGVANLTIDISNFTNNTASFGGAILNRGTVYLSNCSFIENIANQSGGAIFNENGINFAIYDSNFSDNKVTNSNKLGGGAIFNKFGKNFSIFNTTFEGNNVTNGHGGAIYNNNSINFFIDNSTFDNNVADLGGAILNDEGILSILNIQMSNNTLGDIYNITKIDLFINSTTNNDKITITVKATGINGEIISNKTIYFFANGIHMASILTNSNGIATYVFTFPSSGTYIIEAKINGFNYTNITYLAGMATKSFIVPPVSYQIELSITTVYSANKIIITVKAINKNTKQAIVGKTIYFLVNYKQIGTNSTNNLGVATYSYIISGSGAYNINAKINGYTNIISGISHIYSAASSTKVHTISPAKLILDKIITSKAKKIKGKKISTKTYIYKNIGHITGSKKFYIKVSKKFKISGKITKSKNISYTYNKKTKKITLTVKNLAFNQIAQLKFKGL